ncbi:hypothetical protein RDV89_16820 [Nocardioides zeae]|uniref:DUF732 domain-containing protein n=1 Tax=Nocardioides imazamoxiresistens TaxID=3231893 RepID=A0ABU3PZS2_9ACTN|nr:hypothetical protein [Nocardioides zeae]MDT9594752.1 hypothetical protein [Nocardioides zeae]
MSRRTRPTATVVATLAALATLSACGSDDSGSSDGGSSGSGGSGGSGDYCDAVADDTQGAATAYNPAIPGQGSVDAKLAFLEAAGAPEGLEDEHETWVAHLEGLDPEAFEPEPDDVAEAREALFDAQMDCR